MNQVSQIAQYILSLSSPEIGDIISNLKLQKLLYYAQGLHLARYDKLLFEEEFEAWDYGPVVKSVYHEYKVFGSNAIFVPSYDAGQSLSKEIRKFLSLIYAAFGQYSASKLMRMTHDETPWQQTRALGQVIIPTDLMKTFFKEGTLAKQVFERSKKERLKMAAEFLLSDYENDKDLTNLTSLDSDDFYEE